MLRIEALKLNDSRMLHSAAALVAVVLCGCGTAFAVLRFGFGVQAAAAMVFTYLLIILSLIDLRTQLLPDILTKPLIALGLLQGAFGVFTSFTQALLGAVIGYWFFWGINTAFRLIRKKEGMGYGDFKLLAALGAWVGVAGLPLVVLMASFIGILVTLCAAWFTRKPLSEAYPFGPSLALAGWVGLYFGEAMVQGYMGLFL